MRLPAVLRSFNLILDGVGYAGLVDELTLPVLKIKTEQYRAGGMDAPLDIDLGMEKLDCGFVLSEYNPLVIKELGFHNDLAKAPKLTFKGAMERLEHRRVGSTISSDAESKSLVVPIDVAMQCLIQEIEMGTWKSGEKATLKVSANVVFYQLKIDNTELITIDIANGLRVINTTATAAGNLSF